LFLGNPKWLFFGKLLIFLKKLIIFLLKIYFKKNLHQKLLPLVLDRQHFRNEFFLCVIFEMNNIF